MQAIAVQTGTPDLVCKSEATPPPNMPLELTPLRGPKIGAILKVGIGPTALPIYTAAQLSGNPLGASRFVVSKRLRSIAQSE